MPIDPVEVVVEREVKEEFEEIEIIDREINTLDYGAGSLQERWENFYKDLAKKSVFYWIGDKKINGKFPNHKELTMEIFENEVGIIKPKLRAKIRELEDKHYTFRLPLKDDKYVNIEKRVTKVVRKRLIKCEEQKNNYKTK